MEQKQFYLDEKVSSEDDTVGGESKSSSSNGEITKSKVVFPSREDSYPIIGYIWSDEKYMKKTMSSSSSSEFGNSQKEENKKIVYVVISVATGMHQDYHFLFAEYLVAYGMERNQPVIVLTYDYRGMGESRDGEKPTVNCTFFDWAKDYGGALDFVNFYHSDNYKGIPMEVSVVGNSIGAYLMMLTPKDVSPIVQRGFMLSAFNGYNGYINLFRNKDRFQH